MMKPNSEQLHELLAVLLATQPEEINCDQFLAFGAALAESIERGEQPPAELGAALQHLSVCCECREEFETLLRINDIPTDILKNL